MTRRILIYGLIAGLIVGAQLLIITLAMKDTPPAYGALIGYTTMLLALSTIFVAVKRYRDAEGGGVIGFWPALAMGLAISTVAGVIYVAAWEAALAIGQIDFAGAYAKALIAEQQAKGVRGAALAKFVAEMETFKAQYANPLYRLPMTFTEIFPVGVLVSLIAAALLRNPRFMPARRG